MYRHARIPAALLLIAVASLAAACAERGTQAPIVHGIDGMQSPPPRDVLKISTANLWGVAVLGFDWADDIDERFAAMAARLGENALGLDIVLIQEAWKTSARRALLNDAGVLQNFPHRVDSLEEPGGAGLVTLSRYPISAAHFHRFEAQGSCMKFWEGDCLAGKGVLLVKVQIQDRSFWIANTHLIACYADNGIPEEACDQTDPNGRDREQQIIEARRMIEDRVGGEPVILGGDLNFTRKSRYYPMMTRARAAVPETRTKESNGNRSKERGWTENGAAAPRGLDYLWTRPGVELHWRAMNPVRPIFTEPVRLLSGKGVELSDHPILMGEFCLTRMGDAYDVPSVARCQPLAGHDGVRR
jgi:endonuclease/exonuclease/phosphatase family metal-dependent hydrolase